jgi:hypothetical protein
MCRAAAAELPEIKPPRRRLRALKIAGPKPGGFDRDGGTPLAAVSCALVGDVAYVVRIEALRSAALIVDGFLPRNISGKKAVDLGVRNQARQSSEGAF